MHIIAGLIAAAAVLAGLGLLSGALDALRVTPSKWLIWGLTGFGLSGAVMAFKITKHAVATRPDLNRYIGRFLLIAIGVVALMGAPMLYQTWQLHNLLVAAQTEFKKKLPIKISSDILLVDVHVGISSWTYVYDVTGPLIDIDFVGSERDTRKGVCTSGMREWITRGASYIYEYRDPSDKLLHTFEITSCP